MEFLNNHIKIADEELKKLTAFSINSLKSDSENGISVTKAIDNIRRKIWDEFIETSFIYHYKDHFEEVYRIYRLSLSNYNKDKVDEVKSVLKNEAYDEFLMRLKINKVSNYTYGEDFDNITYETFVTHMLKYDVYKKCYNRLSENIDLYELFYETEDYKEFTFVTRNKDNVIQKCELIQKAISQNKFGNNKLRHACCGLAEPRFCVCVASFNCILHGTMCIGSHD